MSEKRVREARDNKKLKYRELSITREEIMREIDPALVSLIIQGKLRQAGFDMNREIKPKHMDGNRIMFEQEIDIPKIII